MTAWLWVAGIALVLMWVTLRFARMAAREMPPYKDSGVGGGRTPERSLPPPVEGLAGGDAATSTRPADEGHPSR
jgi:hypothetical protein